MDAIAQIRSFNRTVTRQIGALDGHFLGRHRSLGACRLLFEIGTKGTEIRELRSRLDLDSGYTSRLLRALAAEGLIRTGQAPADARVRYVALTTAGRKELAVLNRRSDAAAASILEPLTEKQRVALTSAIGTVERLLLASAVRLEVENPTSRPARYCLACYFEELAERFDGGFDPALSIPADAEELTPPSRVLRHSQAERRGGRLRRPEVPPGLRRDQAHVGQGVLPRSRRRQAHPSPPRGSRA